MDEIETPATFEIPVEPKRSSPWVAATTCSALVLLVVMGGAVAIRDRLAIAARADLRAEASEREKLTARVTALQMNLDSVSTQEKPEGEAVPATAKLDALTARLDALEKKAAEKPPEPVAVITPQPVAPVVAAPVAAPVAVPATELANLKLAALSGRNFVAELTAWEKLHPDAKKEATTLSAVAEAGIQSEADLNQKLREALDTAIAAQKIDDVSLAGKINTHLAGLVSIKKASDTGPYADLRRDVLRKDIATLTAQVEALSDKDRKPLEGWLKSVYARRDALAVLSTLDTTNGH